MTEEKKINTEEDLEEVKEQSESACDEGETCEQGEEINENETGDDEACEDVEVAKEEDEALTAKYMRLMADFQNFKRRTEKEKSDIYAYANEKLVASLLECIDNFERALAVECTDESFAEGMKMIFQQFTGILEKAGLEEIKALGEDFDANFHNAVMTDDNPDFESGKVTTVLQKGYMLNKKVIRPSMVRVNN